MKEGEGRFNDRVKETLGEEEEEDIEERKLARGRNV